MTKTNVTTISNDPAVQARYVECLSNGCAPRLAEMLAFQSAPKAMTDREFFEGRGTLAKQFSGEEAVLEKVIAAAKKRGYVPNANDVYCAGLADSIGDPAAFVPATGGRGHVQQVCEQRGWACDGAVQVKKRPLEAAPVSVPLAADIVDRGVRSLIAKDPDKARKVSKRELQEQVIHQHGAKS